MNKQNYRRLEGDPVPPDDSWWAAVLAEEEERGNHNGRAPSPPKTEGKTGIPHSIKQPHIDWDRAQEYYEQDQSLCLKVSGYNRGGLLVEGSGLQGFVPLSHLVDLTAEKIESDIADMAPLLTPYLGTTLSLKVIECDPERGRIVLSERAALAEPGKRNVLLDGLKPGDCVHGFVTNVTDFGVFVDLGGVEGLIHVSELSWGRVRHPADVAEVGAEVDSYVIQVNKDRSRVALSLKRLRPNPWETAESRYNPGMVIDAVITSVVPFGAFARLEEGLDGLIHISEMTEAGQKTNPFDVLREGQKVMVRVIQVDSSRQRLGLSLCQEMDLE
ncbi:MAG: 30S ribosomal protein S1 [Chloroflexi bacterium]|nr:MAG: 30S ribosomal protein S1 [Chloroflexota bacterium]